MQTRFHAFYIDAKRYCISYAYGNAFLLVGAHYDSNVRFRIKKEMEIMKISSISSVFIPEWTDEFCGEVEDFRLMLDELQPTHLILPEYENEVFERYSATIRLYGQTHGFADIQKFDLSKKDKDIPRISNNNVVFVLQRNENEKHDSVCFRFETTGKWCYFILPSSELESNTLKSDIVVVLTRDSNMDFQLLKDCESLKSNVSVRYTSSNQEFLFEKLKTMLYTNKSYRVIKNDVIVMRDSQSFASCYYYDNNTGLITNKQVYNV